MEGALVAAACAALGAAPAAAGGFCTHTADLQYRACKNEVRDDQLTAAAICLNLGDEEEREECFEEAGEERSEARELCEEQRSARHDLCELLGEDRYDPDFDPDDFEEEFTDLNPYFPLAVGNEWVYEGGDETITVMVLDETKLILGVTCIVVNDLVEEDGQAVEDTDDWYGQRSNGDVDYCGEIALNYETFEGDDPEVAELVDVEGSFKAGRDGAKPGTLFLADPEVGDVYRQEWAPGDAEDAAIVLSTTYGYGDDEELDEFAPQELVEHFCDGDCVVTGELNPLEPDAFEFKYYAPGVGLFLEVDPDSGETVELVSCSFAECDDL